MSNLPGALPKEAKNKIGVLIGLACSGRLIPPELVVAMAMQPAPTHFSHGHLIVKGLPVDQARCVLAEKALEVGAKYLWFVDDDTIPPPNSLQRLVYVLENYPEITAVGGVYVTKAEVPQPVVFRGVGLGSFWHWKQGEIFEVTGIGAGCLLISTDVFNEIPKPWFEFQETTSYECEIPSSLISEDISFCNKVREAGYRVFAHGGILCDHYDVETRKTYQMAPDSYPMRPETKSLANPLSLEDLQESKSK
jgi:hypothetical protein